MSPLTDTEPKPPKQKLTNYLFSAAFATFALQIALTGLTFLTSLLVAWTTNDTGFGVFSTVFTWLMLFSLLAMHGTDDLVMRQIPISSPAEIRQLLRFSARKIAFTSLLVAIVLVLLIEVFAVPSFVQYRTAYYIGLFSIPAFAFMYQQQSALRALREMALGQVAEKVLQPLSFILFLLLAYWLLPQLTDIEAIASRTLSLILAASLAAALLYFKRRKWPIEEIKPLENATNWHKSCFYFMLTTVLYGVNTRIDVAMLDLYQTPAAEIAHYNAAARFADILAMPFMLSATVGAPYFAKLYKLEDKSELLSFFAKIRLASFALTCVGFLIVFFFGRFFLSWFGAPFQEGYKLLIILSLCKLIHAFVGPVAYLLMMSNHERQALMAMLISVVVTLALHLFLIPSFQTAGAAWATFGGLLAFELLQIILLRRYIK